MMVRRTLAALLIFAFSVGPAEAVDASMPETGTGDTYQRVIPKNVELTVDGNLKFAFVDSLGRQRETAQAVVIINGKAMRHQANARGSFLVPVSKPGIIVVSDGHYTYGCRVWKHKTAPPRSLKSIAFVQKTDAVAEIRGNALGTALRSTERLYGLAILGLGGVALWQALDRDDAS